MDQKLNHTIPALKQKFVLLIQEHQYKESYQFYLKRRFAELESYMKQNNYPDYSPEIGQRFISEIMETRDVGKATQNSLNAFVNKVNDAFCEHNFIIRHSKKTLTIPSGFKKVLDNFASHCKRIGNKQSTIELKIRNCSRFCQLLSQAGCEIPSSISDLSVVKSCLGMSSSCSWRFVREFLQFLYEEAYTEKNYSYLAPKAPKKTVLPSVYTLEEVQQIENAADISTASGKRNLCILLLASRLAMRAGDIVKLTFDEIDFENDRVSFIQEKTGEYQSFPLIPTIKEALEDYIKNGRPDSKQKKIFLRLYAPYEPLTTSAIRNVTHNYMKKSGVIPNGRRHGTHIFRSSAVTSMVNDGISYEVVRRVLGHSDPNVIQHYAALDLDKLRQCAIPAPEPTGFLKKLLEGRASI